MEQTIVLNLESQSLKMENLQQHSLSLFVGGVGSNGLQELLGLALVVAFECDYIA